MSTESRIEARDAKAAGGVVAEAASADLIAEGRDVLAKMTAGGWVADPDEPSEIFDKDGRQILSTYCDCSSTEHFAQAREDGRGLLWMRDNLATLLDALTAAQAREAGLREEDIKAAYIAGFMASGEGWNGEYPFDNDPHKAWSEIERYFSEYRAPTPEAPDHD